MGRHRGQIRDLRLVIRSVRVARLHPGHRSFRQPCLNIHHGFGFSRGGRIAVAKKLEHVCHVLQIPGAELLRFFIVLGVVIAIRQAQAALARVGNDLRTVPIVLHGAKTEQHRNSCSLQAANLRLEVGAILQIRDALEFGIEGFRAGGFNRGFIHAARVEIANLL